MGIVEKPICAVNLLWVNGFINNVLLSHKEDEKITSFKLLSRYLNLEDWALQMLKSKR